MKSFKPIITAIINELSSRSQIFFGQLFRLHTHRLHLFVDFEARVILEPQVHMRTHNFVLFHLVIVSDG